MHGADRDSVLDAAGDDAPDWFVGLTKDSECVLVETSGFFNRDTCNEDGDQCYSFALTLLINGAEVDFCSSQRYDPDYEEWSFDDEDEAAYSCDAFVEEFIVPNIKDDLVEYFRDNCNLPNLDTRVPAITAAQVLKIEKVLGL
ncbi:hypothetical protein A3709_19320 [Halioglobus sp. HI00S01]|uniref:hypothetical protein n=1 Tax=Halioglobus sp. HI00S01 TaxID=1822214 RepID=UPI0007C262D9|nr:hypothetical protein [Halioglobus sp. HI00S01]KZX57775.1 hypothetical protein A3709_19320 [Halioglobus sp. HI00S01]